MATKKAYYRISERTLKSGKVKRIITIDDSVTPTDIDKADVKMYIESGYQIAHKSQARAKAAKERAEKTGFGKKKDKE
jgi:hypothetical protein